MKHKLLNSLIILFCLTTIIFAQSEKIEWQKDYKKALAEAKESGRPLLLDFAADWCKPCKMMDEQFWVLPDVIQSVKPFIAVKINFDNERSLVEKYRVSGIPFVAFTDPLGNLITFRKGFSSKNAKEINLLFDEMPKDFTPLKKYYAAIEANKDDGNAWLQIADAYRLAKMLFASNSFYEKALKTKEIQNNLEQKERVMATLGVNAFSYNGYGRSINYLEDYLKAFPEGKNLELSYYVLIMSHTKLDKSKNAVKYLELLKSKFPSSNYISKAENIIQEAKNKKDK